MIPGTRVRIKADPGRCGVITGKKRERVGRSYWQVMFPEGPDFILEAQLEIVPDETEAPEDLVQQGKFGRARDLRGLLTHIQLNGRLANLIYSMETTNTDFYAYQFKPVINFLESPGKGIVIADEVGLGKTIEAGLIWTEQRSRADARRLLILCPAMLQEKWRAELLTRFSIEAEVIDATDIKKRFIEFRNNRRFEYALIGSMQALRPRHGWDADPPMSGAASELARFLQDSAADHPLLDLLIVDEAHYLRNPETMTAKLGRLLRDVASRVVLLSATPIHLRSHDLYQLLNLVDEDTFNQPRVFDFILEANEPLIAAREKVLGKEVRAEELVKLLKEAQRHRLLASNRQLNSLLTHSPSDQELNDKSYCIELAEKLEKINLLGKVISRTRKREVQEWRVMREAIPQEVTLKPSEKQFYDKVTGLVRRYCEKRMAHEGFLLVMPQRQMASSMPAALREWQRRQPADMNVLYEDLGSNEIQSPDALGPLVGELVSRAYELGDYNELKKSDSKYATLSSMLKRYLAEFPKDKIVLFAYFRPTLHYLNERLAAEGINCTTLTGGGDTDKHKIIHRFKDPSGPSILLSSEVASEGVDLQFARVIVNYDLPWNPMKIEQRIGRIDRLGQKSPKITIWNLFYKDTIDARIYNRLYRRLDIFERALGGLEPVLGEEIRSLTMDLLRGSLSSEQEEARIEQAAIAVEQNRRQEEYLEREAGNLIAHGDYILNQVHAARELSRWITGEDLWNYVHDFFSREYSGCEFRQLKANELTFDIKLSPDARSDLERFLKDHKLLNQTSLSTWTPNGTRCLFQNRPMRRDDASRRIECVTQFHPLIRFVSQRMKLVDSSYHPAVSVTVAREVVPKIDTGFYVFSVDKWSIHGLRDIERLSFQAKPFNRKGGFLPDDAAEHLLTTSARKGKDWLAAANTVDLEQAAGIVEECLDEAMNRYNSYIEQIEFENNDRADMQEQSLKRHWERQQNRLTEVRDKHRSLGRGRLIPAVEGQIAKLGETMKQRLTEIERQRVLKHNRQELCVGLVSVK